MDILEQTSPNGLQITACNGSECIINANTMTESFILFNNQIIPWPVKNISDINAQNLQMIIDLKPDCVIFGTGINFHFLEAEQLQTLINAQIGYECMKSSTACGSFQLIAGDGREVLAAILLEKSEEDIS